MVLSLKLLNIRITVIIQICAIVLADTISTSIRSSAVSCIAAIMHGSSRGPRPATIISAMLVYIISIVVSIIMIISIIVIIVISIRIIRLT